MFSRKLNSTISYPFIPEVPDRKYIEGILDLHLVMSGTSAGSITSSYKPYYAYLRSVTQGVSGTEYVFYAVMEPSSGSKYFQFTFTVPWTMGLGVVQNQASEECRGAMVVNATYIYKLGDLGLSDPDYEVEPGNQVWLEKQVRSINFINEVRNFDPTQRTNLDNNYLYGFSDSDHILIGSGYNVTVAYSAGSLVIDGNAGNGLGVAPDNMWDVGPSWSVTVDGLLMVNGVVPNSEGDIPIDRSVSIILTQRTGELGIDI
jgi:hypothetical protein